MKRTIELIGKNQNVTIGYPNPIVVNINLGVSNNDKKSYNNELKKINTLKDIISSPNLMMDLSLNNDNGYLYDTIIKEIGCPVGYIPHYACRKNNGKIDKISLLDEIYRAAESGISWFVLHLTPNAQLVKMAMGNRKYPFASRSAVIEIEDMVLSSRNESIYWEIFDEVIDVCSKYSIAISLGAAFRPGVTSDALDEVHRTELNRYVEIIQILKQKDVKYLVEGIGHCSVNHITEFNQIINKCECPFMPLGPMFSDDFNHDDHIINAMSFYTGVILGGRYSVINSITPSEHSGGIPSEEDIIFGYKTALSCARLCNDYLGINNNLPKNNLCINDLGLNCSRCIEICPNKFYSSYKEKLQLWISSNLI